MRFCPVTLAILLRCIDARYHFIPLNSILRPVTMQCTFSVFGQDKRVRNVRALGSLPDFMLSAIPENECGIVIMLG